VQELLAGDVAQPHAGDHPVLAGLHHGAQLVVEADARLMPGVHQAQVHGGELLDPKRAQVVLDTAAQLLRSVGGQPRLLLVPPCPHLAHQDQVVGEGVQRLAQELVRDIRAVELGGIDVVDAQLDRSPDDSDRLLMVTGWAKHAGPGSCMGPNPTRLTRKGPRGRDQACPQSTYLLGQIPRRAAAPSSDT